MIKTWQERLAAITDTSYQGYASPEEIEGCKQAEIDELRAALRQAIEQAEQAEPVAWQYRCKASWVQSWGLWQDCTAEVAADYQRTPELHDWQYEVRALYLHPPTAPVQPTAPSSFPERDESKPAEQQGLFRKFIVNRVDGSDKPCGKHFGCDYFVLDMEHDKHAPVALRAYAEACKHTHPELSKSLIDRFGAPTAPAQQPLIEEQINNIADRCTPNTETGSLNYMLFAWAIEIAHGIKGASL